VARGPCPQAWCWLSHENPFNAASLELGASLKLTGFMADTSHLVPLENSEEPAIICLPIQQQEFA